jgi:acyl carrier protein
LENDGAVAPKIREYVSRNLLFSDDGFDYGDDESFLELGIIDSFGITELLAFVHEEFDVPVLDNELVPDNFDSVSKLTAFIIRKQGGDT